MHSSSLSSTQPIVEEPDDPPAIRRSHSDVQTDRRSDSSMAHEFSNNRAYVRPSTMPLPTVVAFFEQQSNIPFTYAHVHQPYQHVFHQYHPMMSGQGILIEIIDTPEMNDSNRTHANRHEQIYMVTMNGQRVIMNERQVKQLVVDAYQRQLYQSQQQQQFFQ
jgi:hypothetical protein